jgi:hypothetical protein
MQLGQYIEVCNQPAPIVLAVQEGEASMQYTGRTVLLVITRHYKVRWLRSGAQRSLSRRPLYLRYSLFLEGEASLQYKAAQGST